MIKVANEGVRETKRQRQRKTKRQRQRQSFTQKNNLFGAASVCGQRTLGWTKYTEVHLKNLAGESESNELRKLTYKNK